MQNISGLSFSRQPAEPTLNRASPMFTDSDAMVALKAEQLMRLHHEPVHQAA
jgi:hypothetical protein